MPETNAFKDIPARPMPQPEGIGGSADLRNVAAVQVGIGTRAFKADESGIWLGAHKFADASFSVDMQGNLVASSATFGQYLSKTGTSQGMTGSINVKNNKVLIDGVNGRIVMHDGTTNRGVWGDV